MIVQCHACGKKLDESPDLPAEMREPCPSCGGLMRGQPAGAVIGARSHMSFELRQKRPGVPGWLAEHRQKRELRVSVGDAVEKLRIIDRENDRYVETVVAEDGTIIHHVDERLSEHVGHGSAKFKAPNPTSS